MRRPAGFTLIELLVVVALLAILVAALAPSFLSARLEAQAVKVLADLDVIQREVTAYVIGGENLPPVGSSGPTEVWLGRDLYLGNLDATDSSIANYGGTLHVVYLYRDPPSEASGNVDRVRGMMEVRLKSQRVMDLVHARAKDVWFVYPHEIEPLRLIFRVAYVPY